jgi:hypothetical protein
MRSRLFAGVLILFAGWFVWKALPFLRADRQAVWSTPTVRPEGPAPLAPVKVRHGQRACLDNIDYGPGARYVQVTLQGSERPAPALRVEARAPGYRTDARIAGGAPGDTPVVVPIRPADREVGGGTLCFVNDGRYAARFYGTTLGRNASLSKTTIDSRPVDGQISVTLLQSPSASIGSRLGDIASHIAAFRPVTGWEVFVLGILAVLGVPLLVAAALAQAAAADARPEDLAAPDADPDAEPEAQPASVRS